MVVLCTIMVLCPIMALCPIIYLCPIIDSSSVQVQFLKINDPYYLASA